MFLAYSVIPCTETILYFALFLWGFFPDLLHTFLESELFM